MRLDDSGENLIVCDPYNGLLRVNIANKTKETLVTLDEGIDGLPFHFMNDVARKRVFWEEGRGLPLSTMWGGRLRKQGEAMGDLLWV